jgi:hypothetical protein
MHPLAGASAFPAEKVAASDRARVDVVRLTFQEKGSARPSRGSRGGCRSERRRDVPEWELGLAVAAGLLPLG